MRSNCSFSSGWAYQQRGGAGLERTVDAVLDALRDSGISDTGQEIVKARGDGVIVICLQFPFLEG